MMFQISQELLLERTLVISATILLFGLISIGGLWLWRRRLSAREKSAQQAVQAELDAALNDVALAIESNPSVFTNEIERVWNSLLVQQDSQMRVVQRQNEQFAEIHKMMQRFREDISRLRALEQSSRVR